MFEESMVESQNRLTPATGRWTMIGSITLQTILAITVIVLPLSHPESLSFHITTPLVFTPPPPRPPLPVTVAHPASSAATSTPSLPVTTRSLVHTLMPAGAQNTDAPPAIALASSSFGMGDPLPNALANPSGHGPNVTAAPASASTRPMRISGGVATGMLIAPIHPVYPAIARAAGVSGTVVVEAIISRTGKIESLHVLSGPQMLRAAAMDAIRAARYQPFRLNGEPIEVQTTFTVNFKLAG
ncbi:MAG TPA: TonB family protein [Edaphobacter sp.]|nr:TonB family protein [Edaphobacter sp.]